jgi:hypothetical protein
MINNRAKRELRETQKRLKVKMKPMRTLCLKIHFVVYVPMCLKKQRQKTFRTFVYGKNLSKNRH